MKSTFSTTTRALALCAAMVTVVVPTNSIPLHYDGSLRGKGFSSPIVRVAIHGKAPARLLVDTGASTHTLAAWFVKAAGIKTERSSSTARGSTGNENALRVARNLDIPLDDGQRLHLDEAIVVEFPPIFAELRIAGLLSPQLLAKPGDAAVLDLRMPYLSIEPFQQAVDRLGVPAMSEARVCENRESDFRNRIYAIPITIEGELADVIVDSGATSTLISAQTRTAKALEARGTEGAHTQGLGGVAESNRQVPAVEIQRAGLSTRVTLVIGKPAGSFCAPDGLVGMDALRQCLLVMGESGFGMACSTTPN